MKRSRVLRTLFSTKCSFRRTLWSAQTTRQFTSSSVSAAFSEAVDEYSSTTRVLRSSPRNLLLPEMIKPISEFLGMKISQEFDTSAIDDSTHSTGRSADNVSCLIRIQLAEPSTAKSDHSEAVAKDDEYNLLTKTKTQRQVRSRMLDIAADYIENLLANRRQLSLDLSKVGGRLPQPVIDHMRYSTGASLQPLGYRNSDAAKNKNREVSGKCELKAVVFGNNDSPYVNDEITAMAAKQSFVVTVKMHPFTRLTHHSAIGTRNQNRIGTKKDSMENGSAIDSHQLEADSFDGTVDTISQPVTDTTVDTYKALAALLDVHFQSISLIQWRWYNWIWPIDTVSHSQRHQTEDASESLRLGVFLFGGEGGDGFQTADGSSKVSVNDGKRLDTIHERLSRLLSRSVVRTVDCGNESCARHCLEEWRKRYFCRRLTRKRQAQNQLKSATRRLQQNAEENDDENYSEESVHCTNDHVFVRRSDSVLVLECDALMNVQNTVVTPDYGQSQKASQMAAMSPEQRERVNAIEEIKNRKAVSAVRKALAFVKRCKREWQRTAETSERLADDRLVTEESVVSDLESLKGCGPVIAEKLRTEFGVWTVQQFAEAPESAFESNKRLLKLKQSAESKLQ